MILENPFFHQKIFDKFSIFLQFVYYVVFGLQNVSFFCDYFSRFFQKKYLFSFYAKSTKVKLYTVFTQLIPVDNGDNSVYNFIFQHFYCG